MLERFTAATFSPRLGETFRIHPDPSSSLEVELIEVNELRGASVGGTRRERRAPFSIIFRGPGDVLLPQRIYRMEHDGIGDFDLFLVPIGPDAEGMRYEAIFT